MACTTILRKKRVYGEWTKENQTKKKKPQNKTKTKTKNKTKQKNSARVLDITNT